MDSLPKGIGDMFLAGETMQRDDWSQVDSLPKGIGDPFRHDVLPDRDQLSQVDSLPKGIGDFPSDVTASSSCKCPKWTRCRKALVTVAAIARMA